MLERLSDLRKDPRSVQTEPVVLLPQLGNPPGIRVNHNDPQF